MIVEQINKMVNDLGFILVKIDKNYKKDKTINYIEKKNKKKFIKMP